MIKFRDDLPPLIAKPMRLGLAGFCVTLVAFIFALLIDYGPHNPLSFVAFGLGVVGVGMGVVALPWGWFVIAADRWKRRQRE